MSVVNLHGVRRLAGLAHSRLLTGTLVCGRCGTLMVGSSGGGRVERSYRCPDAEGCGRARIEGRELEEVVYAAIVGILKSPSLKRDRVLAAARRHRVEVPAEVERFQEEWKTRGLEWKRAVVARLVRTIVVHPAGPTNRLRSHPGRVQLMWRL